ncbi:MAG TPA: IS4 family transposase [Polyangiales bacterium]
MESAREWAEVEFGKIEIKDKRRRQRLIEIGAAAAICPAGTVTRVCASSAAREGAFRFLENGAISPEAVARAPQRATLERCASEKTVVVAVDQTALTITDRLQSKGLGPVSALGKKARGVHVMSALAVTESATTLGLCSQNMWVRRKRSVHGDRHVQGRASETDHWIDTLQKTRDAFRQHAPATRPWFQLDRGGDCWQVLHLATTQDLLLTVRATHDRRLDDPAIRYLWETLARAPVVEQRRIELAPRLPLQTRRRIGKRRRVVVEIRRDERRTAKVEIRAAEVALRLTVNASTKEAVTLRAVLVRERRRRADAIEWMLLTTHPIDSRRDIARVVDTYCLRWRIEEFHRVWKRGLCRVEQTQLRSRDAIFKWATILATVATRALRLTQLARTAPDSLASSEFSAVEIEALLALRRPKAEPDLTTLTLAQAVRWIADLGGYVGSSNGPPGATVIGRGLHDVLVTARAFEYRKLR